MPDGFEFLNILFKKTVKNMKNHTAKNQVQSLHLKQQLEKANQIFETIRAHTESKNKFLDLLTKNFF